MERIKTFDIQAEPTGAKEKRELARLVDDTINGWLEANPDVDNIRISHAAQPGLSFPRAFIILTYEKSAEEIVSTGQERKDVEIIESSPTLVPEEQKEPQQEPETQRRRGRPPTKAQ